MADESEQYEMSEQSEQGEQGTSCFYVNFCLYSLSNIVQPLYKLCLGPCLCVSVLWGPPSSIIHC